MKIEKLNIENIKRLKVIEIKPSSDVIVIEGKNAQGKTSILDGIGYALGGEKLIPRDPVRAGEERAEIEVDLGDVIVRRSWKKGKNNSTLEIRTKNGEKVARAQEWLNERLKIANFDPSVFIRMSPKERVEELKKIPGLDCTKEDEDYKVEYDKRTLVNRDLDTAKKSLESEYKGLLAPKDQRTVVQIQKEIDVLDLKNKDIRKHNGEIDKAKNAFDTLSLEFKNVKEKREGVLDSMVKSQQSIKELEKTIAEYENKIIEARENIEDGKHYIEESRKNAEVLMEEQKAVSDSGSKLKGEIELMAYIPENDTAKLKAELIAASEVSEITSKLARKAELEAKITDYEAQVEVLNDNIRTVLERKRAKIAAFKFPVAGLEVGETDLQFNKIVFDNLSTAQKLLISAAVSISEDPNIKIIKVQEGSLFDEESMKLLIDFVRQHDFQLWIERVANKASGDAYFIEDGEVIK